MKREKKSLIAAGVLLAVLLVASIGALAATNYGTKDDPLVTLSYLDNTVTGAILDKLDASIAETENELTASFDEKIASSGGAETFSLVTLTNGQKVTCGVGAEIMLRIGAAASYGSDSPRLVNTTAGTSVTAAGEVLAVNNMYMVTIQGNGIQAASDTVKVLIRGSYTIS